MMDFVKGLVVSVMLCCTACRNPQPRPPVNKNAQTDYTFQIKQNIRLIKLQDRAFSAYIKEHPNKHFKSSQFGFWYAIVKENKQTSYFPKPGDAIVFYYQITDLEDNVIYSFDEIGAQQYKIDKQEIISGLQQGLKFMKEGEEAVFLFPSFKAFGVLGDRNRIKTNQPLIYTVYLKKIIIHKNK